VTEATYERRERVGLITLNRPERMNALSTGLRIDLAAAFNEFMHDDDAFAAVLTGAGRAFCAGIDLKEQAKVRTAGDMTPPSIDPHVNPFWDPSSTPRVLTKPVIAAVNGHAIGGGFLMATHADLIIAAESARFDLAVMNRGLPGGFDVGERLNLPMAAAMELALGESMTAARAYDAGLVSRVVPDDALLDEALAVAQRVAARPPLAIQGNVELVRMVRSLGPDDVQRRFAELRAQAQASADAVESMTAFIERRPPLYTGR
jgi:enoyl-CoA hydratase/carnithine racemase